MFFPLLLSFKARGSCHPFPIKSTPHSFLSRPNSVTAFSLAPGWGETRPLDRDRQPESSSYQRRELGYSVPLCKPVSLSVKRDNVSTQNAVLNVHSNIIRYSHKVEITQMCLNWWMGKVWYSHTMEYYAAMKRNEVLITCYNTDESWKYYANISHKIILYNFIYMKCPK